MNKNIVWSLLFVLAFIVGCDDENDPFAGNDNFITSFSLIGDTGGYIPAKCESRDRM